MNCFRQRRSDGVVWSWGPLFGSPGLLRKGFNLTAGPGKLLLARPAVGSRVWDECYCSASPAFSLCVWALVDNAFSKIFNEATL